MKKLVAQAAMLFGSAVASSLFAQGQVLWGNQFTGALQARVYGVSTPPVDARIQLTGNAANGIPAGTTVYTGPVLAGTGFTMGLFLGNSATEVAASTTALQTVPFRTTAAAAGFIFAYTYNDPTRVPGTMGVNVQFRAWDNVGGTVTSWAQVIAGGLTAAGASDVFTVGPLGGGFMGNIFFVPSTTGARSFNLTLVPEPSLIALGVVGLGALLLRRRK